MAKKRKASVKNTKPPVKDTKLAKIKPKTENQTFLVDSIYQNAISFIVGPAGTGKTFLSLATAVALMKKEDYNRIIITRPQVATKKMPFLPGTEAEKNAPFLRPMRDTLAKIIQPSEVDSLLAMHKIEGITLEYMRGMSIDKTIVILDEAQNVDQKEMLMFLTRIGQGTKFIVNGDLDQTDLSENSGLSRAIRTLEGVEGIGVVELTIDDIVRNPLVKEIVKRFSVEKKSFNYEKNYSDERDPNINRKRDPQPICYWPNDKEYLDEDY